MKKRILSTFLALCMTITLLPTMTNDVFAADTITRSEWITKLVETFSMTVESDDNMPDNYFSDITSDMDCYRDILLAVEFGVIDIEAGEAFMPDEEATREFAAQTLNASLNFQLDEEAEYTYSEYESVTYPDDIQVAVNRGWFTLSDGNFLPEQAVTTAEATAMLADAESVLAEEVIDENYDSKFEFADGVIEVPETAQVDIDTNNIVTITDNETEISEGDIFVVYPDGYPVALKALSIETVDNTTVITSTTEGAEDAIISADSEGSIEIDLEDFEFNELTTYSITDTSKPDAQSEELAFELQSVDYDKKSKKLTASQKISLGSAAAGSVTVTLSNLKLHHKSKNKEAYITADTNVTTAVSFDFAEYAGIPSSITLGVVPVAGVGTIALEMEYSMTGGVSMSWDGEIKAGFAYSGGDFRLIKSYVKKGFTFTAEVDIKAGVRLAAQIDLFFANGSIWASVGVRMNATVKGYDSGTPKLCTTMKGYLYAQVGARITIPGIKTFNDTKDIFTESNSPVRVVYHYEDHILVTSCTRGQSLAYTTSTSSRYFNPSPSYAQGSYGGSGTSEPIVIWEYEVEDDGNATITKYSGNATAVAVPSKIDGYKVTKIGYRAFESNTAIRSVTISDNVAEIGNYAFYGCTNLSSVKLSQNVETLGCQVFENCNSLLEIEIPKSLTQATGYPGGPFYNSGLKSVTFEQGTKQVVGNLFNGANNLENVTLLDTMTSIGSSAFEDCTSLKTIDLPNSITSIEYYAFSGCKALNNIDLPDYLTEIGTCAFSECLGFTQINIPEYVIKVDNSAFEGCTNLSSINLSNVETLGCQVFENCNSLLEIEIPKSLTQATGYPGGPFYNSGLKSVTFEQGTKQVVGNLFNGANNLENVTLLDTMTSIGSSAFEDCTSLTDIDIPDSVVEIGWYAFSGCTGLTKIDIPNKVTSIGSSAFRECTTLESAKLPNTITEIETYTFCNCKNLKDIVLPDTVTEIDNYAFEGCESLPKLDLPESLKKLYDYAFKNCDALTEMTIPENVTSIGKQAFYDCDALEKLTIGNSVTSIGSELCYGCDALSDITFGIGLKKIPDSAFRLCQSLEEVILPRYCTEVASNAFAEDTKLTTVTVLPSMTSIQNNSFSYPAKTTMRGVSGSYAEEYADARGMNFETIDVPMTKLKFSKDSIEFANRNESKVLPLNIAPLDSTEEITFTSGDESIATVENGVVTSKGYGTTTITVASATGLEDTITVKVIRAASSVTLSEEKLTLNAGDTATLTAEMYPSDAEDSVTWSSSNENIVTVENGKLTAVGAGTAVITATTTGGKTDTCTVEVIGKVTITATAGEGGKITPSGDNVISSNEKMTFAITPDYGYVIKDVIVDGKSAGARETYIVSNKKNDVSIVAEFAAVEAVYENGKVSITSEAALDDLKLIIATYDDDGSLVSCEVKNVSTEAGEEYQETVTADGDVKLMLWTGLDTMRPVWMAE